MPIKYKKHYICNRIVLDMPDELQKDIILFNQGEKSAFERLYNRYWAQVYNFTGIYINNSVEKEDIVQQTFLKLWELKGKLDPEKGIEGLLFIMTRNQIFNFTHKGVNEAAMKEALMNLKEESSNELEEQIEAQELEKYIMAGNLAIENLRNTLMNELVTGLMKAPAETGFIIQALIFMGIVAGAVSLIGLILRR